jgi:hypothetical protein
MVDRFLTLGPLCWSKHERSLARLPRQGNEIKCPPTYGRERFDSTVTCDFLILFFRFEPRIGSSETVPFWTVTIFLGVTGFGCRKRFAAAREAHLEIHGEAMWMPQATWVAAGTRRTRSSGPATGCP